MIFEMVVLEFGLNRAMWRKYTTSEAKANSFRNLPKSAAIKGHVLEFCVNEHKGKKLPKLVPYFISNWIRDHIK